MKSAHRESPYEHLELERMRKEYHLLERRLARVEHELDDLRDEIAEFEQLYAEQMSGRIAELESLENELGKVRAASAGTGASGRSEGADDGADAETAERPRSRANAVRQSESLKDIYRKVAKTIHPDLSQNEEDRKRRQKIMADANRAYAEEDYVTLLCILDEWDAASVSSPRSERDILEERIARINQQIRAMEAEILRLKGGDIYRLIQQVQQARLQGRDVLSEMAAKLEADILSACQRLNATNRAPGTTGSGMRTVTFLPDRSIGSLYIRNLSSRSFLDWRRFGEAMGVLAVPAGKSLRLDVVPGRASDLDSLHCLSPRDLQSCYLYDARDTDIVHLLRFRELEELYLSGAGVTGEGLLHLLELKCLERLYLYDTSLDDQALLTLKYLTSARSITLCNAELTEAGLGRLRSELPSCSIVNLMGRR